MSTFPCNASLSIGGPAGPLEAVTTCPASPACAVAVICHPHPLHGGTMHNKVVHTLARSFGELGLATVRFNFRGIGSSAGAYGRGAGEAEDALAVLKWVQAHRPQDQIWLAGFSFGAYIALRVAAEFPVAQLVLVAPPVHLHDELGAPRVPRVPMLVLQGEQDEVVSAEAVKDWLNSLSPRPAMRLFPGVGHYFHGRLNDLRAAVEELLRPKVPNCS